MFGHPAASQRSRACISSPEAEHFSVQTESTTPEKGKGHLLPEWWSTISSWVSQCRASHRISGYIPAPVPDLNSTRLKQVWFRWQTTGLNSGHGTEKEKYLGTCCLALLPKYYIHSPAWEQGGRGINTGQRRNHFPLHSFRTDFVSAAQGLRVSLAPLPPVLPIPFPSPLWLEIYHQYTEHHFPVSPPTTGAGRHTRAGRDPAAPLIDHETTLCQLRCREPCQTLQNQHPRPY